MYSESMQNEKASLVSHYGAIIGMQELGPEVFSGNLFSILHILADFAHFYQPSSPMP